MTEIECIFKLRFGLQLGSWVHAESILAEERLLESILELKLGSQVQAESILAEERSLESILELEEVSRPIVDNSN